MSAVIQRLKQMVDSGSLPLKESAFLFVIIILIHISYYNLKQDPTMSDKKELKIK